MATDNSCLTDPGGAVRRARLAAAAAAAVMVLAAAGCGGGEEPAPSRPIQQGPAGATTTSGAAASSQPVTPGPLAPGTYTTVEFRPTLSFRVGAGWGLLGDAENGIALAPRFDPAKGPEKQLTITAVKWSPRRFWTAPGEPLATEPLGRCR